MVHCMDECNKVLLLHGIWMSGLEMSLLRRRLTREGFKVEVFRYPSLRLTPGGNAARLQRHIQGTGYGCLHLVAHSLGGLVLLNLFYYFPAQPPGRVVLLGAPVRGSGVARVLASRAWLRPLLGRSGRDGLLEGAPAWDGARPLGVIAGTGGIGIGRLIGGLEGESDGVVSVSETRIGNAADSRLLPCNHMGLLLDARVARDTAVFLREGRFPP